uniref:Putative transcriptional regulatory protein YLL054C n=1 Tax=Lygus hesperus TaxID=30085 RepID=A0A0A9YPE8_LYGHE
MSVYFKVKNEFGLSGENLEYYQDIQYLKELTKQATALMSRSNAVYNNILNELEIGQAIGGLNATSQTELGKSQDEGRCNQCGLSHGANYCILQQILTEELPEPSMDRSSGKRSRELSKSTFQASRLDKESRTSSWVFEETDSQSEDKVLLPRRKSRNLETLPVFEDLSPKELLDTYEMVCKRYGEHNGKRFLIAHSLAHKKDTKIEPWTVPCDARQEKVAESPPKISYKKIMRECFPEADQFNPLCPDYSDELRKKVETQVKLTPPCDAEAFETQKNWKGIFKRGRQEVKKEVPPEEDDSSEITLTRGEKVDAPACMCGLENCDCSGDTTCMKPPKYVCERDENIGVNYLLTVRNRLERRRRCMETVRSTMATSRDTQTQDGKSHKKQMTFLERAFEDQERSLHGCLTRGSLKESSQVDAREFRKNIQNVTDLAAPTKMMEDHVWRNWMVIYDKKEAEVMNSDRDSDSGDSHIMSECSGITEHSEESDLDYRERKVITTRIPFAEECYKLTDILFDKIHSHFEKSILKNTLKSDTLWHRPTFGHVVQKAKMLETTNKIFHDMLLNMRYLRPYPKRLKPFHITKQSKTRRLEALVRKNRKLDSRRKWSQGIQIGKPYRRYDKQLKYTREGDLEGFSEHKREYLEKPESYRIKSYNLVGDVSGRAINKERIHRDFQLIRNLFDDESETRRRRESMMDEGMKKRLEKYRRRVRGLSEELLPETPAPIPDIDGSTADMSSEGSFGTAEPNVPKKEEMGLEQAAPKKLQFDRYCSPRESSFTTNLKRSKPVSRDMDRDSDLPQHDEADDGNYVRKAVETEETKEFAMDDFKQNAPGSSERMKKASKNTSQSAEVMSKLRACAMKSQNMIGTCKTSSGFSRVKSSQNEDVRQTNKSNITESLSSKWTQSSMTYEGHVKRASHEANKRLASLESLPPIKTLFDEHFQADEAKSKPASRISSAARIGKLAEVSS